MTPARTWYLVLGLSAATAVAAAALATALQRPPDPNAFRPAPIPKIDVHQHVDPSLLGAAMQLAAAHGVRALVNLDGDTADGGLPEQLAAAARYPGRVGVFMRLDLSGCCDPTWIHRETSRLVRGQAAGARGLKVYKELGLAVRDGDGRVPVDSPKLEAIWDLCARLGLPVAVHIGDPRAFFEPADSRNERFEELQLVPEWSLADRARFPDWPSLHGEFVRLVQRHPRVTFIGVHFGNDAEDPAEVAALLDRLPNLYVDTAASIPELGRRTEATRQAILRHPGRVLYGSDLAWIAHEGAAALVLGRGRPAGTEDAIRFFDGTFRFFETAQRGFESPAPVQGAWTIDGLGLPRHVLVQVYRRNAERLLGFRLEDPR